MVATHRSPGIAEGKYEILSVGEVGGMGEVFKVRHRLLDEVRAIKIMRETATLDPQLRQRFLREAKMVSRLRHPNLAQLFDLTFHEGGSVYMVLEWIDGLDLAKLLQKAGPPPVRDALEIATQTLSCLDYLHDQRIVHRDVSTDNLMVTKRPGGGVDVKVIDLGIAKDLDGDSRLTTHGLFVGKLRYAAPEAINSTSKPATPDPRSDLYSFGVVLYELLTGVSPIPGASESELVAGHLLQPPRTFDETDAEGKIAAPLRTVVLRALEKNPDNRFQTAAEFSQALAEVGDQDRPGTPEERTALETTLAADPAERPEKNTGLENEQRELSRTIRVYSREWSLASNDAGRGKEEEKWFEDLRRAYVRRQTKGSSVAASVIKVVRNHPRTMLTASLAALLLVLVGFSGVLASPEEEARLVEAADIEHEAVSEAANAPDTETPEPPAAARTTAVAPFVELISDSPELTSEVLQRLGVKVTVVVRDHLAEAMADGGSGRPRLVVQLSTRLGPTSVEAYDTILSTCEAVTSVHVLAVPSARSLYSRTIRRSAPRCGEAAALAGRQLAEELAPKTQALLRELE